ncbi:MAG: CbiX/SirB N-terminal domain-containing protein [Coriobacteriia bacterium]
MAVWLILLAGSVAAGAATVALLVAPKRWQALFSAAIAGALVLEVRAFALLAANAQDVEPLVLATIFFIAGLTGGYWVTASALMGGPKRAPKTRAVSAPSDGPDGRVAVVLLSSAEPERYTFSAAALRLRRLLQTRALSLPASTVPFVLLSEKARYRAIHGFHPARATAHVLADELATALRSTGDVERVALAWCDGAPSLVERIEQLALDGYTDVVIATLGNDGAFLFERAMREVDDTRFEGVRIITAPSIWHSDALAHRICDRVMEASAGTDCSTVGVALVGEGQPPEWESTSRDWREKETYFIQRVRLLLSGRGIDERNIKPGWLEWQTPDVTEVVRHLAALGCTRVVVVPATVPLATLSTALDMPRGVDVARLAETTRAVVLTPWGDDPTLAEALTDAVRRALRDARR